MLVINIIRGACGATSALGTLSDTNENLRCIKEIKNGGDASRF